MDSGAGDVTRLLIEHRNGDGSALDELIAIVYEELRALAARHARRGVTP